MTSLGREAYLRQLRADLERIRSVLADTPPDAWRAAVPACPGWDLDRLVRHLGGVQRMVIGAVEQGAASRSDQHDPGEAVSGTALAAWLEEGGRRLLSVLDTDPNSPAWSFFNPGRNVGFWQRRQAQEHLVHRYDVEEALGGPTTSFPSEVAADGVSEVVDVMLPLRAGAMTLPGDGVRLVATDTDRSWTLGEGPTVGEAKGSAEDLLLALWGRRHQEDALTITGDVTAVRRVLALPLTP